MLFNSLPFLYGFLPLVYVVFWLLRTRDQRYLWLALTGYVFYGFWNYRFCALMAFSTVVSYTAGLGLLRFTDPRRRKLCLILPIAVDLGLLGFFKYTSFALGAFADAAHALGLPLAVPTLHILLPVGISFYTFHTITYIVDSYRGAIRPTRDLAEFACYVSLFAQLVAGPIVRFRQIEGDLDRLAQVDRRATWEQGWSFFALGLIKKVLIADTLASLIDPPLGHAADLSTQGAWLCMLGYTYQLYFDFSGYSDMAVGLGLLFGLHLPQNFNSPYQAADVADFWRRWHISLSTMLRDYLYIPLGGNRGSRLLAYRNLMLTMLLGGLWHGANWTFVAWGGYHGLLLGLHRAGQAHWGRLPLLLQRAGTFLLVLLGWVLFRADNLHMAGDLFGRMLRYHPAAGPAIQRQELLLAVLLVAAGIAHLCPNTFALSHRYRPAAVLGLGLLVTGCMLSLYMGRASPFLYFQF